MAIMRDSERGTLVAVLTVVCIAACATHVDGAPGFRHLLVPRWETPLAAETQTVSGYASYLCLLQLFCGWGCCGM